MDLIKTYRANTRGLQDMKVVAAADQFLTDITSLENFKRCLIESMDRMKRVNHTTAVTSYSIVVQEDTQSVEIWKRDQYGANKKMIARYSQKPISEN